MSKRDNKPESTSAPIGEWYGLPADAVASYLSVDPGNGLKETDITSRLEKFGINILEEEKKQPAWQQFLAQYKEYMQIVLVSAAVVSLVISDYSTFILLLLLTIFNAGLGYNQEKKAAESIAALNTMMKTVAKVRRDGVISEVPAELIVPGDIIIIDAGDRVPADGRLYTAASLEIEESALTGESTAIEKHTEPISGVDVPLGDRVNMVFMNTIVTRGHGEVIVTVTGMNSEVGHIATMLQEQKAGKTPLSIQVNHLTLFFIGMAAIAFLGIVIIGLFQGESFTDLFTIGVVLAIGSIPDALPAVVTTILSIGTVAMAKQNAIIKNLPSVETLGSTSAINSDKTGTLTMNQMTVREITTIQNRFLVTGEGYRFEGQIQRTQGAADFDLDPVLFSSALCIDSDITDGQVIGDPTEGALYVLAEKGGVNVREFRKNNPRIAEIPFDSDYKFMATFHRMKRNDGTEVIRTYVKGAPDIILGLSSYLLFPSEERMITQDDRRKVEIENEQIAKKGLRVLAFAQREFDPDTFRPDDPLMPLIQNLTLTALVGELDPPRAEAKEAIGKAKKAGIRVRMITGDHAVTASAIGHELGIEGRAITGAEFAALSEEEAITEIDDIGIIARVAPEHKVRLVNILKKKGDIVAMTGDGVNDAPAIKAADIGIAMGITGTDVAKGAAKMILTDDNFATIIVAIEEGRKIYDNLQKFLRMQIANLFMFIITFLGSSLFAIAGTAFFFPGQVLWIHMLVVAPIGTALGLDTSSPGIMTKKPRPAGQQLIVPRVYIRLFAEGLFMAVSALLLYQLGTNMYHSSQTGQTMALVTLSLMNIFLALNLRYPQDTAFQISTFSNIRVIYAFLWVFFGTLLITESHIMQTIFKTTSLTASEWGICFIPGIILLILGEIYKASVRYNRKKRTSGLISGVQVPFQT